MSAAACLESNVTFRSTPEPGLTKPQQVTNYSDVSARLRASLRRIGELERLDENWDGYGSPRLKPTALARAVRLLILSDAHDAPLPFIGPVSGGGIQIEWSTATRELELEILPNGTLEYVKVDEAGHMVDDQLSIHDEKVFSDLIGWLTGRS